MPALETLPHVAEHQRSRSHQLLASRRPVLERPCRNDRDRHSRVLLFKRTVAGSGSTGHLFHGPAIARGQNVRPQFSPRFCFALHRITVLAYRKDAIFLEVKSWIYPMFWWLPAAPPRSPRRPTPMDG